jgi:hypothetical protein
LLREADEGETDRILAGAFAFLTAVADDANPERTAALIAEVHAQAVVDVYKGDAL